MLPKPMVPLSPVKLNANVVADADWFVAIAMFDICALVMFPLIANSTVALLSVFAGTVVWVGVGVGVGVGVEVGAAVGVAVV